MSHYNTKDMELLSEAYNLTLLKEQIEYMTLNQLEERMNHMSQSELEYTNKGLKAILVHYEAASIMGNIGHAASSIGKNIKNAASNVVDAAKNVARTAVSPQGQLANAARANLPQSSPNALSQGTQMVNTLKQLVQTTNPAVAKNVDNMTLNEVLNTLEQATTGQ